MAHYPGDENERRFGAERLNDAAGRIFQACGMSADDARLLADTLVQADLKGIHSHGLLRVPDYVRKLTVDGVDPRAEPRVVRDAAAAIVVDAANAMGQIAGAFAMRKAIERARELNVAFVAVGGSNHCGALDYYTRMALDAGMIGICGTNALPTMAPWGGKSRIVGLNPLSVSIPAGARPPLVLDMALGATAHGKIRVYAQKGLPVPEGWALDSEGRPTTDAEAALTGLIQPLGAFKGIGLAVVVGILSTLLSGAGYGTESGTMETGAVSGADGQFYIAVNVAAFEDIGRFRERMDALIAQFQDSEPVDPSQVIYFPGTLEAEIVARNTRLGIPLNDETVALIDAAAAGLGVAEAVLSSG